MADARDTALEVNYTITVDGTLLTDDPLLTAPETLDCRLGAGSPAIGAATDAPAGTNPSDDYADLPVSLQPILQANGLQGRTAEDLGALEAE